MPTLITVYWFCFGVGLVYVLLAGAMGFAGHGHGGHGHSGEGSGDTDTDFDAAGHGGLEHGGLDHAEAHVELDSHGGLENSFEDAHADAGHGESGLGTPAHGGGGFAYDSGMPDYNPLSPLSLMSVVCGFGAGGLIALNIGYSAPLSALFALGGGVVMALLLWLLIGKLLYSLHASSEGHVADMIGLEAEVLTTVEGDMAGEIAYVLGGTRFTAPARLTHEGRVPQHGLVRIRRIDQNMVYVEEKRKLLS